MSNLLTVITGAVIVIGSLGVAGLGWFAEGMSDAPGKTMGAPFYLGCLAAVAFGGLLLWSGLK